MHHLLFVLLLFSVPAPADGRPGPDGPPGPVGRRDSIGQTRKEFVCPPCGCRGDEKPLDKPGDCPDCGMHLVEKDALMSVSAIPNFRKVTDSVWTGGQPTIDQLGKLREEGVKTIINLRVPEEHESAREEAKARELGMAYLNIPVDYDEPKAADVDSFLRATDGQIGKGRVFIHCTAAIRVGAFWMMRRELRDGWTHEKAREEAKQIGLRTDGAWVDFAKEYIRAHAVKK